MLKDTDYYAGQFIHAIFSSNFFALYSAVVGVTMNILNREIVFSLRDVTAMWVIK